MKSIQLLWLASVACLILGGCEGQEVSKDTLIDVDDLTITEQSSTTETVNNVLLEDGLYFAKSESFSTEDGWMNTVTLEIKDGNLVTVDLNAIHESGQMLKKQASLNGDYKMLELGGAQSEWHEQIQLFESYLLAFQSVEQLSLTDEGTTDAVTGVSINVADYVSLFKTAVDDGPIERGPYQDGHYYAEAQEYDQGYKYYINMIVLNGNILTINWDGINQEGTSTKKEDSINGTFSLANDGNTQSEWYVQAQLMENYLLEKQDPFLITYNENDTTDTVSNVSIKVSDFVELTIQALASGPTIAE
ncbi:MAG TPA: FMN-binding domain-containing protein [Firmicutes bacterium]|nr:FMN-binding domain-containing protein [Bacillota bacterium]